MTRKIYKSAMGKTVDLGALLLQNENIRAVGNMNVNARGDILDSSNRVTEPKNRQVQRRYNKQTNVSGGSTTSNTRVAKQQPVQENLVDQSDTFEDLPQDDQEVLAEPEAIAQPNQPTDAPRGGLAAAIARSREVKQELEKTRRQQQQSQGVKRI
jgi:hypothetical protein